MKTAVVIPVYNEAATIRDVVLGVLKHIDHVIVVDDGSVDGSLQQIDDLAIEVLQNQHNLGKGASLQHGLTVALQSGAENIITLDGDKQHNPDEIPRLLEAAASKPNQIIIAARLKQREQAPKLRLFANQFADFWVSWAAGYPVIDSQSGFRLYPKKVLESVHVQTSRAKSFVFESEILIEAGQHGFYSTSLPVDSIYLQAARMSHYKPWTDTWRIVRMIAGRLIRRGLYPEGLLRAIHLMSDPRSVK